MLGHPRRRRHQLCHTGQGFWTTRSHARERAGQAKVLEKIERNALQRATPSLSGCSFNHRNDHRRLGAEQKRL